MSSKVPTQSMWFMKGRLRKANFDLYLDEFNYSKLERVYDKYPYESHVKDVDMVGLSAPVF